MQICPCIRVCIWVCMYVCVPPSQVTLQPLPQAVGSGVCVCVCILPSQVTLQSPPKPVGGGVCVCASLPHQVTLQPLPQAVGGGVRDLAAQALPLLLVHELQHAAQVLQEVQRPQAAHEGRGGRLAVEHAVGVVQGLGA